MRDIQYLLDTYDNAYVKGEQRSNKTKNRIRKESVRKNRHLILDELLLESEELIQNELVPESKLLILDKLLAESKSLMLTSNDKKIVRYLINVFSDDFKKLHRRASDEAIILAFIFYLKKIELPSIRLSDYRICNKYELTDPVFEIILCRIILYYMRKTPIEPVTYRKDEHEILIREGKR
ncbi:MAG: hypothetical protein IKF11_06705 [Methanobrevibacter sp.]|nr:hypothetical protein [Methanobrevibacter sp.]